MTETVALHHAAQTLAEHGTETPRGGGALRAGEGGPGLVWTCAPPGWPVGAVRPKRPPWLRALTCGQMAQRETHRSPERRHYCDRPPVTGRTEDAWQLSRAALAEVHTFSFLRQAGCCDW
jgi:hypothetical protein